MSDTHIEGLAELAKRYGVTHENYVSALKNILADPAIGPHIPAVKALQEEVERLRFDRDAAIHSGEGAQRDLEALAATNAALQEQLDLVLDAQPKTIGTSYAAQIAELRATNAAQAEQLAKRRVAEDELWDMRDAVMDALHRQAAPHTWESVVATACHKFVLKHREATPTHPVSANQPDGGKWQPIDTAPKGKAVLVACEFDGPGDWRVKIGSYLPDHPDQFHGWLIHGASWKPTRWMPLPAAPVDSVEEGK